jgi:4-amino-4-deoxy-L-arabinose transferase-like glycosyltransferase
MDLLAILLLGLLVPVVSFAPGFLIVRHARRWNPLEKLAASLAASIVLVYLAAFAIYVSGAPWSTAWAGTGLSLLALVIARRDARRLFAVRQVRRVVAQFAGLFAWNLLMLLIVRQYAGGWWGPDWYEHYERTTFFIGRGPLEYEFLDRYLLPARPPLMNLFSAFFLAQAGTQFGNFQLVFAFFNLLPFVPLALLARLLGRGGSRRSGLLALLLAANPMFLHNAQFAWTKAGVGFFVALALWFYVVGWRREDPRRMALAFVSLAAATLVHYSGAPYLLAVGLHYVLWLLWRRRRLVFELATAVASSAMLLGTWVGFSAATYGLERTLAANTAVSDASRLTFAGNLAKIVVNIVDTFVPHLARGLWVMRDPVLFRQIVDNAFCLYQVNLPFMLGVGGVVAVAYLIVRVALRPHPDERRAERLFWLMFSSLTIVLGIAAHGEADQWGLAHIGLQPVVQVALAWLVARVPLLPRPLRYVLVAGIAVDLAFGVVARVHLESRLVGWAVDYNLEVKETAALVFLGDWMPGLTWPLQVLLALGCIGLVARLGQQVRAV